MYDQGGTAKKMKHILLQHVQRHFLYNKRTIENSKTGISYLCNKWSKNCLCNAWLTGNSTTGISYLRNKWSRHFLCNVWPQRRTRTCDVEWKRSCTTKDKLRCLLGPSLQHLHNRIKTDHRHKERSKHAFQDRWFWHLDSRVITDPMYKERSEHSFQDRWFWHLDSTLQILNTTARARTPSQAKLLEIFIAMLW